jgi:hypothetical protein
MCGVPVDWVVVHVTAGVGAMGKAPHKRNQEQQPSFEHLVNNFENHLLLHVGVSQLAFKACFKRHHQPQSGEMRDVGVSHPSVVI